ncbi:MAG: putative oxidoreductase [Alphaproteobacteria bacterium MarineAlpha11_Bin1]|mgnify:CR=1 FL=1|nr:MAG: putative oxidoreductase [Alphaproteobacteria bacterium MarineAlpha11_Bin1]|tara:strand:- start:13995 stop:14759 length:765 start_codon:yes stop_codon:yes gene_type:complete
MDISGQGAIVAGGASGLGAATARALAAAGGRVAILDVNIEIAQEMAGEVGGIAVECDVTNSEFAHAAIEKAVLEVGDPRVLVNCAGIGPAERILGREGPQALDSYARCINVNVVGTFNMLRLVAHKMSQTKTMDDDGERGVIVNTSSVAAYDGQIGQAAYSSSKGAIAGLTLPAARELARFGIRVIAIAPGVFETPMLRGLPQQAQESLEVATPFPSRLGTPDEYANFVMCILGNKMLNGEIVRLDGALRLAHG